MSRSVRAMAGIGMILGSAAMAWAQDGARPPRVEDMGSGPTWLYLLISAAIVALSVALAAFPSRRTFED